MMTQIEKAKERRDSYARMIAERVVSDRAVEAWVMQGYTFWVDQVLKMQAVPA